jgi:hypothetical protein
MADIPALIERLLTDDAFVQDLLALPEQTLRESGVEPTPEILDALSGLDIHAVRKLAASFDDENAAL